MRKRTTPPELKRHTNGSAYVRRPKWMGGNNKYFGPFGSDRANREYEEWRSQWWAASGAPGIVAPSTVGTLRSLVAAYVRYAMAYYSDNGKLTKEFKNQNLALRYVVKLFGSEPAASISPRHLTIIQQAMIVEKQSRSYINRTISRIKRAFKWASSSGLIPPEKYHGLLSVSSIQQGKFDTREAPDVLPVPDAIVERTLPYLTPTLAAMVKLHRICGMRPAELCIMRNGDIDRTRDVWLYIPERHKNEWRGHSRIVALPKKAQAILTPLLGDDPATYIFSPRKSEEERRELRTIHFKADRSTPIFPSELKTRAALKEKRRRTHTSRVREHYDTDSYRRAVQYGIKRANAVEERMAKEQERQAEKIPNWHPNQLRHSASTSVSQLLGQQAAQRWLGHESLDTTNLYTEKQLGELLTIARKLDEIAGD